MHKDPGYAIAREKQADLGNTWTASQLLPLVKWSALTHVQAICEKRLASILLLCSWSRVVQKDRKNVVERSTVEVIQTEDYQVRVPQEIPAKFRLLRPLTPANGKAVRNAVEGTFS